MKYNKKCIFLFCFVIISSILFLGIDGLAQEKERETIKIRVVAVNPSPDREQNVTIKKYLPQEVTPENIVSSRDLEIKYDDDKSAYYAYKEEVVLRPKETRIFEVEVKDVWIISQDRLDALGEQTTFIMKRLEESEFYEPSKRLSDAIHLSLDIIARTQNDETVGRKEHIGVYRNNIKVLEEIKENVERLERQLTLATALPIPEVLEQKEVKTEAPTKTTTWMIIFIIIIFMGMLAGVFFFTWHTQARSTKDFIGGVRKAVYPKGSGPSKEGEAKEK
ncbi:hypothetical protein ACFL2Y_04720 [Candidatus Omnitrophota bacterium]